MLIDDPVEQVACLSWSMAYGLSFPRRGVRDH